MTSVSSALVASVVGDGTRLLRGFTPAWPEAVAVGPASTARAVPGDNLALHRAIDEVSRGEVIVLDAGASMDAALCGDLLALAAQRRGAAGLVVNGAVRDVVGIAALGFPVFHRGTCPLKPGKEIPGELRVSLEIDGVEVAPGDLLVADLDGIVVVAAEDAERVLAEAAALEAREEVLRNRIEEGASTLDLMGLRGRLR